jgi:hypothetical protein
MRRAVLVVVVVGCLLLPAASGASATPAHASWTACPCSRTFAHQFTLRPNARRTFNQVGAANWLSATTRRRIRRGVYDYDKNGYVRDGWCSNHPKLCNMLKACLLAAGAVFAHDKVDGRSNAYATADAAAACAVAAAGVALVARA